MDLAIKNGYVIDGTGNPWVSADVGINRGKLVHIGQGRDAKAERTIDARGLTVTPGFVDINTHWDFTACYVFA